ncbi:hypothetical protein [Chlorogloeopsis sp. ULAP02]|uniref:hypothetical protein n=1 Tax=Chlorogloeopsis sp. ULAP02 TaxID=3107926 RepID=UPI003135FD59
MIPKFYLHRTGKIPTAVHPFVKQTALPQDQQKPEMIQGVQNIVSSTYRKISVAIACLIREHL